MRSHRPFALAAAASVVGLALILDLTPAGAARAGDVTYQQLNTALDVQDNDLIATWRASGPLTRVNASVLATYMQGKLGGSFLQTSNALSELTASATLVRSNLGLGTAATQAIGTSGANVCLMNANCTWSGTEIFQAAVTFGLTTTFTGTATFNGGLFGTLTGSVVGNASTATQWAAAQTESLSGDATGSALVRGAAGWTLPVTLNNVNGNTGTCGDSTHVAQVTLNAKGLATGCVATAISFPAAPMHASAYLSTCNTGGCTVSGGSGVSAVTRNSTGNYTVTFSQNFPSTNFVVICTPLAPNTGTSTIVCEDNTTNGARFVASVNLEFVNGSNIPTDPFYGFNIMVFQY